MKLILMGMMTGHKSFSRASLKLLTVTLLWAPAAWLFYRLLNGQLGAQPSETMNHELGHWTFRFLAIGLLWGALSALGWLPRGLRHALYLRRQLGVMTFLYACLHLSFYVLKEGDVTVAIEQLGTKVYLLVGLTAWSILAVLALTSNDYSVRKLKQRWKSLHRLAYVALIAATVHFALIEKKDWRVTLPWLIPLVALYAIRALKRRPAP